MYGKGVAEYVGVLSGQRVKSEGDRVNITIKANGGDVWLPVNSVSGDYEPIEYETVMEEIEKEAKESEEKSEAAMVSKLPEKVRPGVSYEEMTIEELQLSILEKMGKNGPVTEQMKKTVMENVYHDSLVNWVKSFR